MTYFNEFGQARLGWNVGVPSGGITPSTLWNSIYSVYNADSVGSSSLKTSLYAVYNGESNANDSFGSNNGTAVGGLTYGTGKIGNAFNLNGTNSYVSLPNTSGQFNLTGDFSVSCWFKTNTVSGYQLIFSNLSYNGGARKGFYIILSTNTIGCWLVNQPTYSQEFYTPAAVSINTWYHLSVTRESGVVKIYLNGTLLATDTNAIPLSYVTTLTSIGAYTNGLTPILYHFNGQIDALNIWQKSLTQSEITELYNSGNGAQYITDDFYKPTTNDALLVNNGTAQGGLTYGVGKVGTAFDLNGSNAYVSLPNNSLNLSGNFSYSAWVYFKNVPAGESNIVSATNGNGGANNYGVAYGIISGKLTFAVFNNTSTSSWYSTILSPNTWYHVTVTKTASAAPKFYVNGTLQSTTLSLGTNTLNPVYTSGSYPNCSASIGTYRYNNGASAYAYANARIDAVNVWNKELNQIEITELYNAGNGKQYPN